jgi:hypothetical protein
LVADPYDPKKSMANPVIWFNTELVIEVKVFFSVAHYINNQQISSHKQVQQLFIH